MTAVTKIYTVLIIDPDPIFAKRLEKDKNFASIKILSCMEGKEAQKIIADDQQEIGRIFLNPEVEDLSWISIIRFIRQKRIQVPIYLITEKDSKTHSFGLVEYDRLGVKQVFSKQSDYKELLKVIAPISNTFDTTEIDKLVGSSKAPVKDEDFVPIRAREFLSGLKGLFDVYVRINSERYLMIVHRGDAIDHERIFGYLNKNVEHFYIQKEMQKIYTDYVGHIATAIADKKDIQIQARVSQNLNFGQRILEEAASRGMSESTVQNAQKFVSNLNSHVKEIRGAGASLMHTFISNAANYEHGSGTAAMAGALSAEMNIATENSVQIVGVAALFHDVGLVGMRDQFRDEDESKLTPEERKKYRTHPALGAEIVRRSALATPVILQAIEQHHMRLKNRGFPDRSGSTLVSKVSDIVGICDDYLNLMRAAKADPNIDVLEYLEDKILPGFPRDVSRAFMNTFYPNRG